MAIPDAHVLRQIYRADTDTAVRRFQALDTAFEKHFGPTKHLRYFTAPGRTEVIGNHTDHNGGRILAASVTMDTICAADRTDDGIILIRSEGHDPVTVDTNRLSEVTERSGTKALVAGMLDAAVKEGWTVGGMRLAVSSTVPASAGVSSSASFEMLFLTVLDAFYNGAKRDYAAYARIGRYAENHFWNKASGLMDQMACAFGGMILLDFHDGIACETIDFDFERMGYDLVIVNTGKGHAGLSEAYSLIPDEMHAVANALGVRHLCDTSNEAFLERLPALRTQLGNDRALLRAMHFFAENARVEEAAREIRAGRYASVLSIMEASGNSSWMWLQNCVVEGLPKEQPIPLTLALTKTFLARHDAGVCRIHGGGFAGVIQVAIKKEFTARYRDFIAPLVSADAIHVTGIRATGAVEIESRVSHGDRFLDSLASV